MTKVETACRPVIADQLQGTPRFLLWFTLWMFKFATLADIIHGSNGERFVGTVLEERDDVIVFESESAGRLTLPRARIEDIQRGDAVGISVPQPAANETWLPPGVGNDGYDWVQLNTDEWLKGRLRFVQKRSIDFESDKLEDISMEWKDVKRIYTGQPMFAKFDEREPVYGGTVVSNQMVIVNGPEQVSLPRDQLTGITPGGVEELSFWSGKLSAGLNLQSGNSDQITANLSGELSRRTPTTALELNYLGNFSEVNGVKNADNHRLDGSFDFLLTRNLFLRPVSSELYRDPIINIKYRGTVGVGAGYYIFNEDRLQWLVAGGPAYQYTEFETVESGRPTDSSTPAVIFDTSFRYDLNRRLKLLQSFGVIVTKEASGLYTHHSVTGVEFEIRHHLDLNVSLVWDYLLKPQPEASGLVPQQTDLYLVVGLGVKF